MWFKIPQSKNLVFATVDTQVLNCEFLKMNIFICYFNCKKVMFLLVLHLIIFSRIETISGSEPKPFTINKCCPKGEEIYADDNFQPKCKKFNFKTANIIDLFPIDLIVNATTLKIHENNSDKYRKILKENYQIVEGFRPNCTVLDPGIAVATNDSSDFYFILYDNLTMKFHISMNSSHHLERGFMNFEKVAETDAEKAPDSLHDKLHTFSLSDACIDFTTGLNVIIFCRCHSNICIKKCCEKNQFYNISAQKCQNFTGNSTEIKNWRPQTEGIINHYYVAEASTPNCSLIPLKETKTCSAKYYSESDNEFQFFPNGSIKIKRYKTLFSTEEYCGEATWHDDDRVMFEDNLFICLKTEQKTKAEPSKARPIIYGTLLIIGGICLVITVSISFYLPELRRKMHNKIALSHNFSLMVACFVAGISQLYKINESHCILFASLTQFSFLGSFFWLNVMCIDIFTTFRATRSVGDTSTAKEQKKFIYYSMYAWGSTAIITLVTIVMETLPRVIRYDLRPGFSCHCGFNTETSAVFIYFYGPMALILATNVILFVFTTVKIMTIQRQTAILHKTDSSASGGASYQSDKQRLILYAKLFILMGLSWVTEILSWAIGGPEQYWYFTDGINLFRAIFIFILFICKRPLLTSLKRRLNEDILGFTTSSKSESLRERGDQSFRKSQSAQYKPTTTNSIPRASKETQSFKKPASTNANRLSETQI